MAFIRILKTHANWLIINALVFKWQLASIMNTIIINNNDNNSIISKVLGPSAGATSLQTRIINCHAYTDPKRSSKY